MSETLTTVTQKTRANDQIFLKVTGFDTSNFQLEAFDKTFSCFFDRVDVFVESGEEWATFYSDDVEVFNIETEEDGFIDWPHWLFEELYSISSSGELRPEDEYETTYSPTRNAA